MPNVYLSGIDGLGNCLFQLATAIYYREKYNYNIFLIKSTPLLYGTSIMFGRMKCHTDGGVVVTYDKSIFNKLTFIENIDAFCQIIDNNYTANHIIDGNLFISGYNQNLNLFRDVFNAIPRYLNLEDPTIKSYIINKYGDISSSTVICLRIGDDFKHMNKITAASYLKALALLNTNSVYVIGDMSNHKIFSTTSFKDVEESDIVQLYFGMMCKNYILSESTFHLWMAYLGTSFGTDLTKKVICFNDTDITNRNLHLDSWIRIDY